MLEADSVRSRISGYDGPPTQPVPHVTRIDHKIRKVISEDLGLDAEAVVRDLKAHAHNNLTTTYFLLLQRKEREAFAEAVRLSEARAARHAEAEAHGAAMNVAEPAATTTITTTTTTTTTTAAPSSGAATSTDPMVLESPRRPLTTSIEALPERISDGALPPLRKESVVASQLAQAGKKTDSKAPKQPTSCRIL